MPTNVSTELIVVPPARSRAAISGSAPAENTDDPSPKLVPFARRTASSTSGTVLMTIDRAERLLLHGRAVLGHVDEHDRVDVRRLDRVEPADERGGAARRARRRRAGG